MKIFSEQATVIKKKDFEKKHEHCKTRNYITFNDLSQPRKDLTFIVCDRHAETFVDGENIG